MIFSLRLQTERLHRRRLPASVQLSFLLVSEADFPARGVQGVVPVTVQGLFHIPSAFECVS